MRERIIRIVRFVDWKFILVFTLMIMAMTVYYLVDTTTRQRDEALQLISHKEATAAAERREAAVERKAILTQLADLQTKYDASVKINREFVTWLRAQGYRIPDKYVLSENVRLETSDERNARTRREAQQNQERKRSGGGTTNSGPDKPGSPHSGGQDGGSGNSGGRGDHEDRGQSGEKSHGQNAGGNGKGQGR